MGGGVAKKNQQQNRGRVNSNHQTLLCRARKKSAFLDSHPEMIFGPIPMSAPQVILYVVSKREKMLLDSDFGRSTEYKSSFLAVRVGRIQKLSCPRWLCFGLPRLFLAHKRLLLAQFAKTQRWPFLFFVFVFLLLFLPSVVFFVFFLVFFAVFFFFFFVFFVVVVVVFFFFFFFFFFLI